MRDYAKSYASIAKTFGILMTLILVPLLLGSAFRPSLIASRFLLLTIYAGSSPSARSLQSASNKRRGRQTIGEIYLRADRIRKVRNDQDVLNVVVANAGQRH